VWIHLSVDHVVVATNHFVTAELRDQGWETRAGTPTSESEARRKRSGTIERIPEHTGRGRDQEGDGPPRCKCRVAICRHQLDDNAGTISNTVFMPAERKLLSAMAGHARART